MKKTIFIILVLLVFFDGALAQKAPDGFLGIKWGITEKEFEKIVEPTFADCPVTADEILKKESKFLNAKPTGKSHTIFDACGHWEKIGDAYVYNYHFLFSDRDEFYSVRCQFPKSYSFNIFLKALTEKYGKPKMEPLVLKINPNAKVGASYQWIVEDTVVIVLEYNDMEKCLIDSSLSYVYIPIWDAMYKKDTTKTKNQL